MTISIYQKPFIKSTEILTFPILTQQYSVVFVSENCPNAEELVGGGHFNITTEGFIVCDDPDDLDLPSSMTMQCLGLSGEFEIIPGSYEQGADCEDEGDAVLTFSYTLDPALTGDCVITNLLIDIGEDEPVDMCNIAL